MVTPGVSGELLMLLKGQLVLSSLSVATRERGQAA